MFSRDTKARPRGVPLAATLGPLLLLVVGGCGEPDCAVNMTLMGAIEQIAVWDSVGENLCSAEELSGLVVINIYQEITTNFTGVSDLQVNVQSPTLMNGTFPATVVVSDISAASFSGDTSTCTVTISNFSREDWTVTDYVNFTGTLACSAPLQRIGGGGSTVELGPTQFTGHMLYE